MKSIEKEIKFVLSGSRSGYALSSTAIVKILERKGGYTNIVEYSDLTRLLPVSAVKDGNTHFFPSDYLDNQRDDEDLVAVVEELGSELASHNGSELYVKTVSVSIHLNDFNGLEKVSNIYCDEN